MTDILQIVSLEDKIKIIDARNAKKINNDSKNKTMNICGNCKFWVQEYLEPQMGKCTRALKDGKAGILTTEQSLPAGIAVRFPDNKPTEMVVLFGINFGCVHFEKLTK